MDPRRDFGRTRRLRRKTEFDDVLRNAAVRVTRGPLWLAARNSGLETARLGLIVGKRMLPLAVDRNRAKRVIRETFRQASGLPAMDIVVHLRTPAKVSAGDAARLFGALGEIVERRRRSG